MSVPILDPVGSGGSGMKLLWTNPNPTTQINNGQTVGPGTGLSEWDLLLVTFSLSKDFQAIFDSVYLKVGQNWATAQYVGNTLMNASGDVVDAGIHYNSGGANANIVREIYGIKL